MARPDLSGYGSDVDVAMVRVAVATVLLHGMFAGGRTHPDASAALEHADNLIAAAAPPPKRR